MNIKTISRFVVAGTAVERGRDTVHAGPVEAGAGVESRGEAAIVGTLQLSIQCEHNSRAANSRPCYQGLLAHISQTLNII